MFVFLSLSKAEVGVQWLMAREAVNIVLLFSFLEVSVLIFNLIFTEKAVMM